MDTILTMNPGSTVLFIVAAVTLVAGVIVYIRDTGTGMEFNTILHLF